jgi:4-amino-4-deoxy-L-arabinose transferase-like glycosyltransferase
VARRRSPSRQTGDRTVQGGPARERAPRPRCWDPRFAGFLAAVLAIKLIVMWQLKDHPLLQPDAGLDTTTYVHLARRVLAGDPALGPGLYYMSPLYIYFLAAGLAIADSFTFVRAIQAALGTAAVACIYISARDWFGERAAWIAAILAALTGVFTFYEILILQSSLDSFLTAAALACLTRALVSPGHNAADRGTDMPVASAFSRTALASGIFFGLQGLNRPNVLIAVAGVLVVLAVIRRLHVAALVLAGLLAALAPVVLRNVVVAGDWALVSSQGGLNFYIGNHAGATGQYDPVPGVRASVEGQSEDTKRVAENAMRRPLSDSEVSAYFSGLAWSWMRDRPAAASALFARKLGLVFNAEHQWLDFSYPYYAYDAGTLLGFLVVGPWLLVPLGFMGIAVVLAGSTANGTPDDPRRTLPVERGTLPAARGTSHVARRTYLAWASFVPFYAVAVAAFFVAERYRLPIFVPLCIAAGAALDRVAAAAAERRWRQLAGPVAVFAIAAIAANWPFNLNTGRFDERLRLAKVLMNNGDYGSAATELERALAIDPRHTVAEFNLGLALVSDRRAAEGIPHIRHAVDAGVPVKGARYALVRAMQASGDTAGAAALLRTFQPEASDDAESCFQVGLLAVEARTPEVAERYFRRAIQLRPDWGNPRQQLGMLLAGENRFAEAATELRAALDRGVRDAQTYGHLAYCEAKLGRPDEARRLMQTTLQIDPNYDLKPILALLGGREPDR